jgi:hypothetical protein
MVPSTIISETTPNSSREYLKPTMSALDLQTMAKGREFQSQALKEDGDRHCYRARVLLLRGVIPWLLRGALPKLWSVRKWLSVADGKTDA